MRSFFYKWIPIFFGCHQRSDRSFYFKGKQFPICARCTGELIGMVIAIIFVPFYMPERVLVILIFMLPMLLDGFLQLFTSYESKNYRRLITGIFFGYSFLTIFFLTLNFFYNLGGLFADNIITNYMN